MSRYANLDRIVTPNDSIVDDYLQSIDISKSNNLLIKENENKLYWNSVEFEGYVIGWYKVVPRSYVEGYMWKKYNPPAGGIVGEIKLWSGSEATIPSNYVLCDGRTLNKTSYSDLFDIIGTRYGESKDIYFRVPDLRGRLIEGCDKDGKDGSGSYVESSLPNVTANWNMYEAHGAYGNVSMDPIPNAAIYVGNWSGGCTADNVADPGGGNANYGFNASRASSIYKNYYDKVQPPALSLNYIICIESL